MGAKGDEFCLNACQAATPACWTTIWLREGSEEVVAAPWPRWSFWVMDWLRQRALEVE